MEDNRKSPIDNAREAAERARAYERHMQLQEEREERMQKDERRRNIPLVKPKRVSPAGQANYNQQIRPQRMKTNHGAARPQNDRRQGATRQYKGTPGNVRPNSARNSFQTQVAQYSREEQEYRKNVYGFLVAVIATVLSFAIIAALWLVNILPVVPRSIITGSLLILCIVIFILAAKGQYSKKTRISGNVIGTIFLVLIMIISYALFRGLGFLNSLHTINEKVSFEVRVMQDSPLQSIHDLDGRTVGIVGSEKEENILKAIDSLSTKNGIQLSTEKYANYTEAVDALYTGNAEALLFNNAKTESLKEAYPDFENETRVLYTETVEINISNLVKSVNTSKESFNLYISGIDTYGEIESVSRSDVNIIMTVNPKDKTILLTNIPRDTYVHIYGTDGGYDKLTHAGIYGIETSVGTLEELLDTKINYFARVNFTSLIELVDVLGGVELENPVEFTTRDGNHYFPAGWISLNGEEALAFSRERYNLAAGDIDRGKNQLRVIEAMINKATQPEILSKADELMSRFDEVAETNMPAKDISNLVNAQLSNNSSWSFETITLKGTGRSDLPSYNMPGSALYMYDPDPQSVQEIQNKIQEKLNQ